MFKTGENHGSHEKLIGEERKKKETAMHLTSNCSDIETNELSIMGY